MRLERWKADSGSHVQGPALAGGNSLFRVGQGGSTGAATDVQGLSASHSRQTSKESNKLGGGVSGRHHQDGTGAKASAGGIANANAGDHFFDLSGDLAANDVLVSLEGHGE